MYMNIKNGSGRIAYKTEHDTYKILHVTHKFAHNINKIKHMTYNIAHIVDGSGHGANIFGCNMNEYRQQKMEKEIDLVFF